jgi:tetratricopeptide (TPR) repeat protein
VPTARQLYAAAEEALTEAAFRTGDFTSAERLFDEALALAGQGGDREAEALAVGGLGMVLHYRGIARLVGGLGLADADVAAEEELMRRALAIWQESADPAGTARALFSVGLVLQVLRGNWDAAMEYFCRPSAWLRPWRKAETSTGARRSTGTWAFTTLWRTSARVRQCGNWDTRLPCARG